MKGRTRVSAAAWVVVRDAHAAEDIFQNVALKAMTKRVSFETESALMSWAFITSRREGIDWLRRHQRETTCLDVEILELLEYDWQTEAAHPADAKIEALENCLAAATPSSRRMLKLRYFEGHSCEEVLHPRSIRPANQERKLVPVSFRPWQLAVAAAALITLLVAGSLKFISAPKKSVVRVSKVTGSSQHFGSKSKTEHALTAGTSIVIGDTLETRSCDAWIELMLADGSTITIAGHSTLRILGTETGNSRFELLQGSMWGNPAKGAAAETVLIQTPTIAAEMLGTQFDIQTSPVETMLRVNEGSARVRQNLDGSTIEVWKGHQLSASLARKDTVALKPQSSPIDDWSCDLWEIPEVILGKWLPAAGKERARLGADPLLWPIPGRDPLMLYAVALAAWKSTDHPVSLHSNSKLCFRGRTERAQMVRFGFSAQKMRGAFAGKFEIDIPSAKLGPAGQTWEVELPLGDFHALHPHLATSPDQLELTDVYALTVQEDAGLEINHIELVPWKQSTP